MPNISREEEERQDKARKIHRTICLGFIDDVILNKKLKPWKRIVGVAIGTMMNANTGDTFADPTYIAERIHFNRLDCVEAINELASAPHYHLEIIKNVGAKNATSRGRTFMRIERSHTAPCRSERGDLEYHRERAEQIEAFLFENADLSPAQRLIGIAIALFTDPDTGWCSEGQSKLARLIGLSRDTVCEAITEFKLRELVATAKEGRAFGIKLLSTKHREDSATKHVSDDLSDYLSDGRIENVAESTASTDIPLIPCIIPFIPSRSADGAACEIVLTIPSVNVTKKAA